MDYQRYEESLADSGASVDPAEAHGSLCGHLCAQGQRSRDAWLEDCLGRDAAAGAAIEILTEMHAQEWRRLHTRAADFQPLMPSDEADLERRVEALALWCQGFLRGLAQARLPQEPELERRNLGHTAEVMRDFSQIARAGYDARDSDPQDGEEAYTQLVEYVRVAVQTVFEELEPLRPATVGGDAQH